jgi:hypothetical protein
VLFLILASETVTFVDHKGKFLLTLQLNMPSSLRSTLIPRYQAAFPCHLQVTDTAAYEDADVSLGEAIHFSWYNRYSTLVSFILFYSYIY